MLATIGDLIDDIVVRPSGPIRLGTDTESRIVHRRGGSAANVAAAAAQLGAAVRFIGQVGDDGVGHHLVAELAEFGVDVTFVRHAGSTGTIIVLLDESGERTMLTDRGACLGLGPIDSSALAGVSTLHVPLYGIATEPIASSVATLVADAHERDIRVSIDLSSVALLDQLGHEAVGEWLARLDPHVVFANADEAPLLELVPSTATTVAKHGARPAVVTSPGSAPTAVPAIPVDSATDTTGAGDAFAAGYLVPGRHVHPIDACGAAHRAAADHLARLASVAR